MSKPKYPEKCPITNKPLFMELSHPELGIVPTYGGGYDSSYTIPKIDEEGYFVCYRYDHDEKCWADVVLIGEAVEVTQRLHYKNEQLQAKVVELARQRDDMRKLAGETGVLLADAEDKVKQLEGQCATQQAAIKEYFAWRNACGDKEKTHDELRSHIEEVDKLASEALAGTANVKLLIKAQIGEEVLKIAEMPSSAVPCPSRLFDNYPGTCGDGCVWLQFCVNREALLKDGVLNEN